MEIFAQKRSSQIFCLACTNLVVENKKPVKVKNLWHIHKTMKISLTNSLFFFSPWGLNWTIKVLALYLEKETVQFGLETWHQTLTILDCTSFLHLALKLLERQKVSQRLIQFYSKFLLLFDYTIYGKNYIISNAQINSRILASVNTTSRLIHMERAVTQNNAREGLIANNIIFINFFYKNFKIIPFSGSLL